MHTTISEWFGRTGNNIQQLSNAIYFCKKNNLFFSSPAHPYIRQINLAFGKTPAPSGRYYYFNDTSDQKADFLVDINDLNKERKKICEEYIYPNFKLKDDKNFDDDTLIIHLRSGDVFCEHPHPFFTPNPLSYYLEIIKDYKKIIIVTEDRINPILGKIGSSKDIIIQQSSFEEDFSTLMGAKNLASSGYGTFCIAAALCSKKIKHFYYSNIFGENCLNGTMLENHGIITHFKTIDLSRYIQLGEWKNTLQQRELILNYR